MTTTSSKQDARDLAKALLEARLAGCVQLVAVDSLYTWEDKLAEEAEFLLLIKTRTLHYAEIERTIKRLHKYRTPEIVQLPIEHGSSDYLHWLDAVT